MVKQDKLKTLRLFLDKLNATGTVNREEVLSLESAIETALYTSKKDIVYLSPSSACIGVDEVKSLVENEIKKTESEVFITYTAYIRKVRYTIDMLNKFKNVVVDAYEAIPRSVFDLISKNDFRLTWVSKEIGQDGSGQVLVQEFIDDINDMGFFRFFKYHLDHLQAICELNPEKATEVYNCITNEIQEFEKEFNTDGTDASFHDPILQIFDLLQMPAANEYGYKPLFVLKDKAPVKIFTMDEFYKTYSSLGLIKKNIENICNVLEQTTNARSLEHISQEEIQKLVSIMELLANTADNPRLLLFSFICKHLSKL